MIRTLLILLFLPLVPAIGQPAPVVKTKVLTYALGGLPESFTGYFRNGGEIMMFRASEGTLGVPIRYEGPRRFVLRESEAAFAPSAEGKQPPPLAWVDLPENAENVLILAAPSETGGKVRLIAYDISPGSLGRGEYRVFNFSHSMLSMIFGSRKCVIAPGADQVLKDGAWNERMTVFPIKIATIRDGVAKPVYSNFWEHHPGNRTLLFMFNGSRPTQAIRFMDFSIDVPAETTAAGM